MLFGWFESYPCLLFRNVYFLFFPPTVFSFYELANFNILMCRQNPLIPDVKRDDIIGHIVLVHQSVVSYSNKFLQRLRRSNYVTPKNYLDFINTYLKLLHEKDQFILQQVLVTLWQADSFTWMQCCVSLFLSSFLLIMLPILWRNFLHLKLPPHTFWANQQDIQIGIIYSIFLKV